MSTMTIATPVEVEPVTFDLYRDIHKGIRSELFAVTSHAGDVDPSDRDGRSALAGRVDDMAELLVGHAAHEDAVIQLALEVHLPQLAERIETEHITIEGRLEVLRHMAATAVDAGAGTARRDVHRLYLELASFTGAYLEHQDAEERVVMPALHAVVGTEAVIGMHQAIISSIPPEEMATALALMVPAMNIDDRAELLGGMQANAPAEVFAGVWGLTHSVLSDSDYAALAVRLGLGA
jgi:hypothetical protein